MVAFQLNHGIHRIHKWRTRGKKLVPSHESEALEDKQKSVYYLHVWTNFGTSGLLHDMQNNANFRNFKLIMARHYSWLLITTPLVELPPSDIVAPCIRKEIRIPESGKFFLLERGILGFGIRNRVQGIKISIKTGIRNPSSTDEKSGIPGTWNQEATAWNP